MPRKRLRVLVFGNPLLAADSLLLRLLPKLRSKFPAIDFVEFDPNEGLEKEAEKGTLTMLDSVDGIAEVSLFTEKDVGRLELCGRCSMHDFDLAWNLKLLEKLGLLNGVRIIGVPQNMGEKQALAGITSILSSLS